MTTAPKHNHFFKLLSGMAILLIICIYSCNGSSKEEKKDTAAAAPMDTSMKVKADTTKTDTAGKGGQPAPGGH